jgi:hypothetical protein
LSACVFAGLALAAVACEKQSGAPATAPAVPGGTKDQAKWPTDDRSLCEWKNRGDVEVVEAAGPGAYRPNIRRVFQSVGDPGSRNRVLICREIDTNLDGIKDVARSFNTKGEAVKETADTNFDGKVDVWSSFVAGRLSEEQVDTNHDGRPDVWKNYNEGVLTRIKRDRNFDGYPDVWEVYTKGHLERIGVDENHDGHVDRWDRDQQVLAEAEEAERKARDALAADGGAPPAGEEGSPAEKAKDKGKDSAAK